MFHKIRRDAIMLNHETCAIIPRHGSDGEVPLDSLYQELEGAVEENFSDFNAEIKCWWTMPTNGTMILSRSSQSSETMEDALGID